MIGNVPSGSDAVGNLDEQFVVVALVEPLPVLERVPVAVQSVLRERVELSIAPETLGPDKGVGP